MEHSPLSSDLSAQHIAEWKRCLKIYYLFHPNVTFCKETFQMVLCSDLYTKDFCQMSFNVAEEKVKGIQLPPFPVLWSQTTAVCSRLLSIQDSIFPKLHLELSVLCCLLHWQHLALGMAVIISFIILSFSRHGETILIN